MNKWIAKWFEEHSTEVTALSDDIWAHPELSLHEFHACEVTADMLKKWGFEVKVFPVGGVERPNAIEASWGSGHPIIGIVGEYDALPNLGQKAVSHYDPIPGPGHGCGHNLMCGGTSSAAAALRYAMEQENISGTVKFFATPAEEKFGGKIMMDKDGMFDDLDICLNWHPGPRPNSISEDILLANGEWSFIFHGKTAHAAGQPWKGRSALDACEIMSVGVNYLREHVTQDVRIHYAYDNDRMPSNVVPEKSAMLYSIRALSKETYLETAERVCDCARGAAMMTGTTVECIEHVFMPEARVNNSLNRYMYEAYKKVPLIEYTEEEMNFARDVYRNTHGNLPESEPLLDPVMPAPTGHAAMFPGSSDLCTIMYHVPTAWFFCYGDVINTIGHHWSQVACSGMSIGHKGELFAGQVLAQTGYDLFEDPAKIQACHDELNAQIAASK